MNQRAIEKTELNKILETVSDFAVTDGGKHKVRGLHPTSSVTEAQQALLLTEEAVTLLFTHGLAKIEHFSAFDDEI